MDLHRAVLWGTRVRRPSLECDPKVLLEAERSGNDQKDSYRATDVQETTIHPIL